MTKVTFGQALNHLHHPGIGDFKGFGGFVVRVFAMISLLEVVLNEQRGARVTPLSFMLFGTVFHVFLALVSTVFEIGYGEEVFAIALLLIVAVLYRRAEGWAYLRAGTEPKRHTYFLGISVFRHLAPAIPRPFHAFILDYWTTQRITHPLILILLGVLVFASRDSYVVGAYLCIGGVCTGLKNQLLYENLVNQILDLYDAKLSIHVMPRLLDDQYQAGNETSIAVTSALRDVLSQIPEMEGELSYDS